MPPRVPRRDDPRASTINPYRHGVVPLYKLELASLLWEAHWHAPSGASRRLKIVQNKQHWPN